MDNNIAALNVGGKLFTTYRSTLTKYPDTFLGTMYSQDNFKVDEVQFFDRSPELFEYILAFYRTDILCKPEHIPDELWSNELKFWLIPVKTQESLLLLSNNIEPEKTLHDLYKLINTTLGFKHNTVNPRGPGFCQSRCAQPTKTLYTFLSALEDKLDKTNKLLKKLVENKERDNTKTYNTKSLRSPYGQSSGGCCSNSNQNNFYFD